VIAAVARQELTVLLPGLQRGGSRRDTIDEKSPA